MISKRLVKLDQKYKDKFNSLVQKYSTLFTLPDQSVVQSEFPPVYIYGNQLTMSAVWNNHSIANKLLVLFNCILDFYTLLRIYTTFNITSLDTYSFAIKDKTHPMSGFQCETDAREFLEKHNIQLTIFQPGNFSQRFKIGDNKFKIYKYKRRCVNNPIQNIIVYAGEGHVESLKFMIQNMENYDLIIDKIPEVETDHSGGVGADHMPKIRKSISLETPFNFWDTQ